MRKARNPDVRTPEEKKLWADIRADMRERRRQRREEGLRETYSSAQPAYTPSFEGLKRGPKPDPNRECTEVVLTARVTKREAKELRRHHRKLCKDTSPSSFMRFVLCQWLEAHRDKAKESEPFSFNPDGLDWRTKRHPPGP